MPDKMTIDDIAEALGVSKTTVSRAISGMGPGSVPTGSADCLGRVESACRRQAIR